MVRRRWRIMRWRWRIVRWRWRIFILMFLFLGACSSATERVVMPPMATERVVVAAPLATVIVPAVPVSATVATPLASTATSLPTSTTVPLVVTVTKTAVGSEIISARVAIKRAATATRRASPVSPTPTGPAINGIPLHDILVMPENVIARSRQIYAQGQTLGRSPRHFSKLGDSTVMKPVLLGHFDRGLYVLGMYDYLQPTIDHYAGSFNRVGVASRVGLHTWSIFDPFWANKEWCEPNEHMLACEFRLNNPSLLIIRLGSNDDGPENAFRVNLRDVIEFAIEQGVLPLLVTKADRFEGEDNRNNEDIRALATEYELPLWEFDKVAQTLPNRGLDPEDNVHLIPLLEAHDYTVEETFTQGHAMQDLTGLMMLELVWREVVQ